MAQVPGQRFEQTRKQSRPQQRMIRTQWIPYRHRGIRRPARPLQCIRRNKMRGSRLAEALSPKAFAQLFCIVMPQIRHTRRRRKPAPTRGHPLDPRHADDLLDQIHLAGQIRTKSRHAPLAASLGQSEPRKDGVDFPVGDFQPEQGAAAVVAEGDRCQVPRFPARDQHLRIGCTTRRLQNQLRGACRCRQNSRRINPSLEAVA